MGDNATDNATIDVAEVQAAAIARHKAAGEPDTAPVALPERPTDDTTDVKVRIPLRPQSGDTRDEAPAIRRQLPLSATAVPPPEEPTDVVNTMDPKQWRRAAMLEDDEFTDVSSKPGEELLGKLQDPTQHNSPIRPSTSSTTSPLPDGLATDPIAPIEVPSFSDVDPHKLAYAETAALGGDDEPSHHHQRSATVQSGEVLLGRYRIGARIGRGGMATVYSAEHVTIGKKVAVKVLDPHLAESSLYVDRFLQEARAASMISHQNVVAINDFGYTRSDNLPFFVMEYLDGEDLRQTLEREERLPWTRARHIALQICSALEAAHKKGVIHRDIKPENCFILQRDEQRDFVKLLDFGIAKVTKSEPGELTSHGVVLGTLEYMSPERALNQPVDARADVYSLGVLLYRMMSGRTPFQNRTALDIVTAHIKEKPVPPRRTAPLADISAELENVIMRCLAKSPDDRFQSAAELARNLRVLPDKPAGALYELMTDRQPVMSVSATRQAGERAQTPTPIDRKPLTENPFAAPDAPVDDGPPVRDTTINITNDLSLNETNDVAVDEVGDSDEDKTGDLSLDDTGDVNLDRTSEVSLDATRDVELDDANLDANLDDELDDELDDGDIIGEAPAGQAGPGGVDQSPGANGGQTREPVQIDYDDDDDPTQTLSASRAREIAEASLASARRGNAVDRALAVTSAPQHLTEQRHSHRSDTVQSDAEPEIIRVTESISSASLPSGVVASGVVSTGRSSSWQKSSDDPPPGQSKAPGANQGTIDISPTDIFSAEPDDADLADMLLDGMMTVPQKKKPRKKPKPPPEVSPEASQPASVQLSQSAEMEMTPTAHQGDDAGELGRFSDTDVPHITGISERARRPEPHREPTYRWVLIAAIVLLVVAIGLAGWKFVLGESLPFIGDAALMETTVTADALHNQRDRTCASSAPVYARDVNVNI